ncbi:inositol polyphosphate 1-phosphatase [Malaya genurostris]|uniref:inositol polyphosphate 1-phosphatase n=1 Tax=Malaya genurostris TaxID=325434 RepID=UPI0026F3EF65|nr:inositol polyphosphate 1-phosphatase [Malaya genurostris]
MSAIDLLKELIKATEKAANIARICRKDDHLFSLLVQEKSKEESNSRFEHDFKTLADCLIQEVVKHDIGKKFPGLRENIRGEENPSFTNAEGESIVVTVSEDKNETIDNIQKILNGDRVAAIQLVEEVFREIEIDSEQWQIPQESISLDNDINELGIWIDPIDATAEYIRAQDKTTKFPNIKASGLECVTVLIGVYETVRGDPIIGVVNQPFASKNETDTYESRIYWGLTIGDLKYNNVMAVENEERIAVLSPSEQSKYVEFLKNQLKYEIVYSSGAGHKILKVITGEAELFLLSKGTTYKWDTCAPQAILKSLDGELFNLQDTLINKSLKKISYHDTKIIRNTGGLIAYRNIEKFKDFLKL